MWGGVSCFLLLAFLAVVGDGGFLAIHDFKRHLKRMETQLQALEQENVGLRAEMIALKNELYPIEKLAREELGLARPDELIFALPDSGEPRK